MAHPQLSSLQPLLTLKVTVLQLRCSIVSTFCQFVIMVGDSGGIVSQVRTTWFLSWKLSIFFLTSPELTFLHCTLHLSSPSFREHSLTFCYGCIAVLGDELLYFAVPWCTVVHCYCPMMYCIEVLSNIVFWCIALHCIVGWCFTLHCLLMYCIALYSWMMAPFGALRFTGPRVLPTECVAVKVKRISKICCHCKNSDRRKIHL